MSPRGRACLTALRWILGIGTGAFAIGWGFLVVAGGEFKSPPRARRMAWMRGAIPIVVAILFLAAVVWPEREVLMHAGAVLAVGLLGLSLLLAREAVFVACLGVVYCLGWLVFYFLSIFGNEPTLVAP